MVQLSEKGDRTSRSIRAIAPNASLASFANRPRPIRIRLSFAIYLLAGASIDFDWPQRQARLTSQGDMCYGASAISGLNLHIPSSKS
ncbi:hypothetical protein NDI43_13560 [Microcoleus vaginatus GB2-A3]|uniref:hypothetical protein n=1 Tax=Microcoleus vaginatus TaxID=119532 RepID=UPI0032A58803